MTEQTFRQPPMFLDLDGLESCQPLARNVRPTKRKRQQSQQFLQSLTLGQMCLFQTKAPRLQAPEQVHDLPAQGIVSKYPVGVRAACDDHVLALAGAHPHQGNIFPKTFLSPRSRTPTPARCVRNRLLAETFLWPRAVVTFRFSRMRRRKGIFSRRR